MLNYLIDVNLPYYFSLWRGEQYVHQNNLNDEWSDSQIWDYARLHGLTIVTNRYRFFKSYFDESPSSTRHPDCVWQLKNPSVLSTNHGLLVFCVRTEPYP